MMNCRNLRCFLIVVSLLSSLRPSPAAGSAVAFRGPFGVAVGPDDKFYVAEIGGKCISKFAAEGKQIGEIRRIEGYGDLKGPFSVHVDRGGKIYIADTLGHSVLVLGKDEKLLLQIGTGKPGAAPGEFHEPHFLTVRESDGAIFVADTHNHRIQVFSKEGTFLKTFGSFGEKRDGDYHFAGGLDLDDAGNLYSMNWTRATLYVYDRELKLTHQWGDIGNAPGQFSDAYGVTWHDGAVWVADTYNSRLQKFTPDGKLTQVVGGKQGSSLHEMNHPTSIAFNSKGEMYVADWKNDRVLKLTGDGHFLQQWGGAEISLAYQPPRFYQRDPKRGPLEFGGYVGADRETVDHAKRSHMSTIWWSFDNQLEWPIAANVEYAHSVGVKIYPSIAAFLLPGTFPGSERCGMWKRGSAEPEKSRYGWCYPEVRSFRARTLAQQAKKTKVDGILLDYIRYPNPLYGYEPETIAAFQKETGKDANSLDPQDPEWCRFRARYVGMFLKELREELRKLDLDIPISIFSGPDPDAALKLACQDWKTWAKEGLIDELNIELYLRDYEAIYNGARLARENLPDRVKLVGMVACWGGNLDTPVTLTKGMDVAVAAGVDKVCIYRHDAIYKFNLWPAIAEAAAKTERK